MLTCVNQGPPAPAVAAAALPVGAVKAPFLQLGAGVGGMGMGMVVGAVGVVMG